MIVYSVALLPVGLTLTLGGLTGPVFGAVSLLLNTADSSRRIGKDISRKSSIRL